MSCFWQAVLGLRWFRERINPTAVARDHQVSRATAYRYVDEVIEVLHRAWDEDPAYLVLGGKGFSADRCGEKTTSIKGTQINLWYSGNAHEQGGNIQVLASPGGFPLWVSDVEPGSVHDLTAARGQVLAALHTAAAQGLPTLADGGYDGADIGVRTPVKQPAGSQVLDPDARTRKALLRGLRCLGERGFAVLTGCWRTLHRLTAGPAKSAT